MNAISAWIMSILGIVIVGTLIDLILPNGRINKYIKSIFATLTVLVIVTPIPSLIKNNFNTDDGSLITPDFTLDENYLAYADKVKLRYLAKGVEKKLSEDGLHNVSREIVGKFEKDNSIVINLVKVNLKNLVIDENIQHINKYELITELVTKYLNVEKGAVIINE